MVNKKTVSGIGLCLLGILLVKIQYLINITSDEQIVLFLAGVIVAFSGISCFASGLKKRITVKIRICPNCFYKNDINAGFCKKCRKELHNEKK